jgi:hypothetical protein
LEIEELNGQWELSAFLRCFLSHRIFQSLPFIWLFYLAIDTSSLDISLIFFGKISGFRHLSLQLRDIYEFEGRFSDRIVAGME